MRTCWLCDGTKRYSASCAMSLPPQVGAGYVAPTVTAELSALVTVSRRLIGSGSSVQVSLLTLSWLMTEVCGCVELLRSAMLPLYTTQLPSICGVGEGLRS